MDFTPALDIFRLVAAEFKGTDDDTVKKWIGLCMPLVSRKRLGKLYYQALALLVAHRMKLTDTSVSSGDDPLAAIGNISVGNLLRVGQYSEGEVSIGFNAGVLTQFTQDANAEYALTSYGIQYLKLIRMLMSITSAGEPVGRI